MNAYEDHANMLDALHEEQVSANLVCAWNGNNIDILPGGAKFKRKNDRGGYDLDCDLILTVTTKQFADTLPESGERLTYLGLNYVFNVETMAGSYQLRFTCMLENAEK